MTRDACGASSARFATGSSRSTWPPSSRTTRPPARRSRCSTARAAAPGSPPACSPSSTPATGPARGRAVLILAHLRLPQGTARLEPMLDDDDPDVRPRRGRRPAARGGPRRRARARPRALQAPARPGARDRAARQPWAVESLLAQLRELDASGERRAAPRVGVARALGHAGDPRAEPAMIELLRRGSLEERISAARALGAVGGSALPARAGARAAPTRPGRCAPRPPRRSARSASSAPCRRSRPCSTTRRGGCARTRAASLRALGAPGTRRSSGRSTTPTATPATGRARRWRMDRVGVRRLHAHAARLIFDTTFVGLLHGAQPRLHGCCCCSARGRISDCVRRRAAARLPRRQPAPSSRCPSRSSRRPTTRSR